ncbi:hypothetical protein KC218_24340, partial [Mycobacterium tuberculosis]|nr:hypothetical protein [Mycobacterium tuberculosis]
SSRIAVLRLHLRADVARACHAVRSCYCAPGNVAGSVVIDGGVPWHWPSCRGWAARRGGPQGTFD